MTRNEQELAKAINAIEEERAKLVADANKQIEVEQKIPFIRVFEQNGASYYLDHQWQTPLQFQSNSYLLSLRLL